MAFKLNGAGAFPLVLAGWLLSLLFVAWSLFVVLWSVFGYVVARSPDPRWFSAFGRLALGQPGYMVYLVVAIVVISMLYVALLIDPDQVAEKFKRYGAVISGIEPGEATADHIDKILTRTTILGCVYLAVVALVPEVLIAYVAVPFYFGGLSALIVVCTLLDLQTQVRGYKLITISRERQQ